MRIVLGGVPPDLDPTKTDLTLRVSDDDDVLALTIPAGTLVRKGRGRFVLAKPLGSVATASLRLGKRGAELRVATARTDLSRADREEHLVTVSLAAGTWRTTDARIWTLRDGRLVAR
jgi:hypothetical protein